MTTWQEVNAARRQARRDARVAAVAALLTHTGPVR